jgi:hypothetical protein
MKNVLCDYLPHLPRKARNPVQGHISGRDRAETEFKSVNSAFRWL